MAREGQACIISGVQKLASAPAPPSRPAARFPLSPACAAAPAPPLTASAGFAVAAGAVGPEALRCPSSAAAAAVREKAKVLHRRASSAAAATNVLASACAPPRPPVSPAGSIRGEGRGVSD